MKRKPSRLVPVRLGAGGRVADLSLNMYEGIYAIVVNLVIAVVATLVLRVVGAGDHETRREDYEERAEVEEEPLPVSAEQEARFRREAEPTRRP